MERDEEECSNTRCELYIYIYDILWWYIRSFKLSYYNKYKSYLRLMKTLLSSLYRSFTMN